jgi:hypothetical protein
MFFQTLTASYVGTFSLFNLVLASLMSIILSLGLPLTPPPPPRLQHNNTSLCLRIKATVDPLRTPPHPVDVIRSKDHTTIGRPSGYPSHP